MATELINQFSDRIDSITLHHGTGGAFEVSVDGQPIYSKLQTKRYPELSEIVGPIRERVQAAA
jgi:selenoprotein W-related protein